MNFINEFNAMKKDKQNIDRIMGELNKDPKFVRFMKEQKKPESHQEMLQRPLTHAELEHAITFLFSSSVINSNEATSIYNKALPFTKG